MLHPSPAQLSDEYKPAYTLQDAMGNLSTIYMSLSTHLLLNEPRHHCRHL